MHLSENQILLLLEGKIEGDQRAEINKHLAECSECTTRLADIYSFSKEISLSDEPVLEERYFLQAKSLVKAKREEKIRVTRTSYHSLVFALSVVIVAFVTMVFYFSSQVQNVKLLNYRGEKTLIYNLNLNPSDGVPLDSNHLNFSWNKIKNAVEYKMTVFNLNGDIIFNKSVTDTILNLNSKKYFIPGKTYLWNVIVYLPDGRYIKSSVHSFEFSK